MLSGNFRQRLDARAVMLLLLLFATLLLVSNLDHLSLSADEFFNILIEREHWSDIVAHLRAGADLHPPLTHLIMHGWLRLVGESEWTVRFLWAMTGVVNLALTFRLGAQLFTRYTGVLGALLLLTSPTYLLYMRFEKYYAFTMTLSLVLLLTSVALWRRQTPLRIAAYALTLVMLLYTDYLAPLLLTFSLNILLFCWGRQRERSLAFLGAQFVAAIFYLPWLTVMAAQATILQGGAQADLGRSGIGMLAALMYWPYSIGVGETLFPWRVGGAVGAAVIAVFAVNGVKTCLTPSASSFLRSGLALLVTLMLSLLGAALLTTYIFAAVPFIAFPNHTLFAAPLFALLLAIGAAALPLRWSISLVSLLLFARVIGIGNYFTATDFHNPIYAVPMREITQELVSYAHGNDMLIATPDVGLHYYFARLAVDPIQDYPAMLLLETLEPTTARITIDKPARIWLFQFGRDRTAGLGVEQALAQWLVENGYTLHDETGYVEQDRLYRQLKTFLFRRPAYQYKLVVQEYVR
ncbi:MAG TPA: hypothetical protein DCL15_10335 [Chloroflexi bacterium]|nr:hypothetical protein [Chloroflexota bacterium]HHW88991.1 hypothetical protein [Chloroflexota bacterium]